MTIEMMAFTPWCRARPRALLCVLLATVASCRIAEVREPVRPVIRNPSFEEDGTDAFERQFALDIARSENDSVFEIDEALRRLSEGDYGVCEECGCLIGKARLKALPFARMCIECKAKQETGTHASSARVLLNRLR